MGLFGTFTGRFWTVWALLGPYMGQFWDLMGPLSDPLRTFGISDLLGPIWDILGVIWDLHGDFWDTHLDGVDVHLALVGEMHEHVLRFHGLGAPLFAPENQPDPPAARAHRSHGAIRGTGANTGGGGGSGSSGSQVSGFPIEETARPSTKHSVLYFLKS